MNQQPQQPQQPRRKKKSPLLLIVLVVLAYYLIQGRSGGNQAPQNDQQVEQTVATTQEVITQAPTTQAPTTQASIDSDSGNNQLQDITWDKIISGDKEEAKTLPDTKAKENAVLKSLTTNFEGQAKVEFDDQAKAFVITPIAQDMIDAMTQALQNPQEASADWSAMLNNLKDASKTYQDVLGKGYQLQVANPDNPENMLVQVKDGQIVYDAMKDVN